MIDIPLGVNLPEQQVTDPYGQHLENVLVGDLGVRLRWGYANFVDTTAGAKVDGIFDWTAEHGKVIVVSNGNVYSINTTTSPTQDFLLLETGDKLLLEDAGRLQLETVAQVTDVTGSVDMQVGNRVTFAQFADKLYMANGAAIQELFADTSIVYDGSYKYTCIKNHTSGETVTKTGTYGRSGTTVTVSITAHGLTTGDSATLDFSAGTGGTATDGTYTVTVSDANTYTITDTASGAITGSPAVSQSSTIGVTNTNYWSKEVSVTTTPIWVTATRYGSGKCDVLEDNDAPQVVKMIASADSYLLALEDGTQRLWFSYIPGSPWDWRGDYVDLEYAPDDANCIKAVGGEVYVGGPSSLQILTDDGVTPWIQSNYGSISHGVIAPYSFTYCSAINTLVWIDHNRQLVRLEGRNPVPVNRALDTWLREVPVIEDAIGDFCVIEGIPYYFCQFPTSEQSLVVNLANNTWCETSSTHSDVTNRFDVSCIASIRVWNMVLIGHTTDGKVYQLSSSYNLDGADPIIGTIRTQRIPAEGVTIAPEVTFYMAKVARSTSSDNSTFTVKWRDDDNDWTTDRTVTMVNQQNTSHVKHIYRCGSYRFYRQYQMTMTDCYPYSISKMVQK